MDADYFSNSYGEARARFRALSPPGAVNRSFNVPSARDPDLFVDSTYVKPRARPKTLLVLTSGVHGAEGFAGSAIQLMFLSELRDKFASEHHGLFMVHAMNPFGMKYNRRATENNVNLNRNFGVSADLFLTPNAGYDRVADFLEPRSPARSPGWTMANALYFVIKSLLRQGFSTDTLNRAIAHGQFNHPRGIEYGGTTWEPQVRDFIDTLKTMMEPFENIVLFDLHTGLGESHELHVIAVEDPKSRDEALLKQLFRPTQDGPLYKLTGTETKGFYKTAGDFNSLPAGLARPGQRVLALTFEYGTLGNSVWNKVQSLARVLGENQGYHHGYTSAANRARSGLAFTEMFSPAEPKWRANVISRAREVLGRVVQRFD